MHKKFFFVLFLIVSTIVQATDYARAGSSRKPAQDENLIKGWCHQGKNGVEMAYAALTGPNAFEGDDTAASRWAEAEAICKAEIINRVAVSALESLNDTICENAGTTPGEQRACRRKILNAVINAQDDMKK